jgi:unsaturated rhamnogalacturonyl hydrolase
MYNVALIKGEVTVSSGIDVWTKRTRALVIDEWYRRPNYHRDDGDGLDDYQVGRSRGCGGLGIWSGGRLWVSINFSSGRVIATGPVRSEFELGYDAWDADGRRVSETKRIRIDAGSNMSRARSLFTADGGGPLEVAAGIARRSDPAAVEAGGAAAGWMTQWQAPDRDRGCIACAVIIPGGGRFEDESASVPAVAPDKRLVPGTEGIPPVGNRLLVASLPAPAGGGPYELDYYFGAGWSKSGDFPDARSWQSYVARFADRAAHPISVAVSAPAEH